MTDFLWATGAAWVALLMLCPDVPGWRLLLAAAAVTEWISVLAKR